MKILHIVPGLNDPTNGIAVAAKMIAAEQSKSKHEVEAVETRDFISPSFNFNSKLQLVDEVWVHSMWLPMTVKACWKVLRQKRENLHSTTTTFNYNSSPRLVRMPHGCMDPVKVAYHWNKKRWVAPIERWLLRRCDRIVSTEEAEDGWIKGFVGRKCPLIERISLNRPTFDWSKLPPLEPMKAIKTILYVGRLHPLKGVRYLIAALPKGVKLVTIGKDEGEGSELKAIAARLGAEVEFKGVVSQAEKEAAMRACDLFVLPTLSENYGLVVEEVLMCGKRVITTDGAPAWKPEEKNDDIHSTTTTSDYNSRLIYLKGFRDGTDEERVRLLKETLEKVLSFRFLVEGEGFEG